MYAMTVHLNQNICLQGQEQSQGAPEGLLSQLHAYISPAYESLSRRQEHSTVVRTLDREQLDTLSQL